MKTKYVVGLARVFSCYGGPEEGGWYYEAGEPVGRAKVFYRLDKAMEYRDHLRGRIEEGGRFRGVGVGGCGDDEGLCTGEVMGDGLDAVIQSKETRAERREGLVAWPAARPYYS